MKEYLILHYKIGLNDIGDNHLKSLSVGFYAAAWTLCRRGILRPGITMWGKQSTEKGNAGDGYSLTPFGQEWIIKGGDFDYVPSEPGRFSNLLNKYGSIFGVGFKERSQEAVRCYGAHAFLACCAMCGAAAESILLAIAVAKSNDESKIFRDYSSRGGRGRIENFIIGQQQKSIQDEFRGYTSLLKYWRDYASHGRKSNISDNEAYTALLLLLRLVYFSNDKWNELIQS